MTGALGRSQSPARCCLIAAAGSLGALHPRRPPSSPAPGSRRVASLTAGLRSHLCRRSLFRHPPDPEYYAHRIGRTGRAGQLGEAITFVNPREMRELRVIERVTGARIRREEVPTATEADEREARLLAKRVLDVLSKDGWAQYRPVVDQLVDDNDPMDIAAAALAIAVRPGRRLEKAAGGLVFEEPAGMRARAVRPGQRGPAGPPRAGSESAATVSRSLRREGPGHTSASSLEAGCCQRAIVVHAS